MTPLRTIRVVALAAFAVGLGGCVSERSSGPAPAAGECRVPLNTDVLGGTLVAIRGFAFLPGEVRVKAGSKVTWVNCESADVPPHTSTSDQGTWGSPTIAPGVTYSRIFDQVGTFSYHCEPHPFMTAKVVVE